MRAAVYHGPRQISVEEVPEPSCGRDGQDRRRLVRHLRDDLHEYLEGPIFVPPADRTHPITGESLPLTIGHEVAGRVVAVGEGVHTLGEGDPDFRSPSGPRSRRQARRDRGQHRHLGPTGGAQPQRSRARRGRPGPHHWLQPRPPGHHHPLQDGRIDARGLITKRIGLEEIVAGGFTELIEHKDRHAKILVRP